MPDDVFSAVREIEAEADRILADAHTKCDAIEARTNERIDHLKTEADLTFNQHVRDAEQHHEAERARHARRADSEHDERVRQLEAVRTEQVDALADWVIDRLVAENEDGGQA
jgi:F0F1-type ATP synthase membrane subunit b/b'